MTHHSADVAGRTTPLAPVFLGLRLALHTLIVVLVVFVITRAVRHTPEHTSWIISLAILVLATYISGAFLLRTGATVTARMFWLGLVTVEGLALIALTPDAAFLAFPLFFLQLHVLPPRWGVLAVGVATAITVAALAGHTGWSVGGVVGPVIGAAVAVTISLGYRALYRETEERQKLIDDLVRTRAELASRERESGVLQERGRLAREIHDTVAQGLSSIQLLLHAAERDPGQAADHVRLARETAATSLEEARRFIRELTPPALEEQSLAGALERLAASQSSPQLRVTFRLSGTPHTLPMRVETALLRIAQASLANVTQHADATRAELTLTYLEGWVGLDVVDDGRGFDPDTSSGRSGFGLPGLRARVAELGGVLEVESRPGEGTAIAASFDLEDGSA